MLVHVTRDIVGSIVINLKIFFYCHHFNVIKRVSPRQVLQWRPIEMLVNIRKIVIHIQIHCSLGVLKSLVVVRSRYDAQVQPRELHLGLRKSVTVTDYSV